MTVAEGIAVEAGPEARTKAAANVRLAWLFLLYSLPAVVFFSVAMAPLQVADEYAHFLRADQVSRGVMTQQLGGMVDGGIYAFGHLFEGIHFHPEVKVTAGLATKAGAIGWSAADHDENFQNTRSFPTVVQWQSGKMITVFPKNALLPGVALKNVPRA